MKFEITGAAAVVIEDFEFPRDSDRSPQADRIRSLCLAYLPRAEVTAYLQHHNKARLSIADLRILVTAAAEGGWVAPYNRLLN